MACFGLLQANTVIAGHRIPPRITHHQNTWLDLRALLRRLVATLLQAVYRGFGIYDVHPLSRQVMVLRD